jgi:hypothetical protein
MQAQILAPAAVLIVWSLVMLFWVAFVRFPAMAKLSRERKASGDKTSMAVAGGRGQDLEGRIPDRAVWPAHNFTHLMEQPTIFYPAVIILAIMGAGGGDVLAAWLYVALRIVHSVWQATINTIPVRMMLFFGATGALIWLAVRAIVQTLLHDPTALAI